MKNVTILTKTYQKLSKLISNQFSGIDRNLKKAIESTWCPFKYDLKEGKETIS